MSSRVMNFSKTFRMFVVPTFFAGMASVLDLGGTLSGINVSDSSKEADELAIKSDWEMVGKDMQSSMDDWELNYATKSNK